MQESSNLKFLLGIRLLKRLYLRAGYDLLDPAHDAVF